MTFQSQFTSKHLPPVQSMMTEPLSAPQKQIAMPIQPKEQDQPVLKGRGRMSTRNGEGDKNLFRRSECILYVKKTEAYFVKKKQKNFYTAAWTRRLNNMLLI